ncbi:hypothetical protein [Curtobacterium sp. MCPF17_052]|uniref:hypothetical protein n=1 Tax=Curtobacterium sp. MCPF17_052 TaxID=2175655 RepID=UPI0034640119
MDGHRAAARSNLSRRRGGGQDPEADDPELEALGVLGLLADDPEPDDPDAEDPEPDDPEPDDPEPDDPEPDELDPDPPSLFGVGRESVR